MKDYLTVSQVQDIVVGNKTLTDMTKPSEIVQLLLNDEQLASLDQSGGLAAANQQASKGKKVERKEGDNSGMGDLWNEEGDDFFGASGGGGAPSGAGEKGDEDAATPTAPVKKRRSKATGAPRGRKPKKKDTGPHEQVMEM